jgi:TolB protein
MRLPGFLSLLILLLCSLARAERVSLESYASSYDTVPLAIVPFKANAAKTITRDLPWEVIADDLEFTCRFKVLRVNKADSAVFSQNNIGIFVTGEYTVDETGVSLDCYIHDAVSLDLLLGKKFHGEPAMVRSMAHRFANQLVETLFGEKGFFESKIVFVRFENGNKNLWLADYDGKNMRSLTNMNTINIFPTFIDSTTLIWASFLRGKPDLYKGSIATGKSQIFIASRFVQTSPAASPVVGKLAYGCSKTGNMQIYTCDYDASNTKQLTFNKAINTAPCWSPNGYQIAFTSDRGGAPQIYLMDADGGNAKRLTKSGGYQDSPAWSPKGDMIAYQSLGAGKFDVWTAKLDGSDPLQATTRSGNNTYPAWSPDGRHILFASGWGNASDLWVVRPDGTGLRRITTCGNAEMPDWSHF